MTEYDFILFNGFTGNNVTVIRTQTMREFIDQMRTDGGVYTDDGTGFIPMSAIASITRVID